MQNPTCNSCDTRLTHLETLLASSHSHLCEACLDQMQSILDCDPVSDDDGPLFSDDEWEEFLFLAGQPNAISNQPTINR